MFTNLGKIIGVPPRHAENSDTRQDIRRQNPDTPHRKKNENNEKDDMQNEDDTVLSISALSMFLENFLETQKEKQENKASQSVANKNQSTATAQSQETAIPERKSRATYAANIYEKAAQTSQNTPPPPAQAPAPSGDMLETEDIRTILTLLEDIKTLKQKNIEYIQIEKAETFLQSLVNAVHKVQL